MKQFYIYLPIYGILILPMNFLNYIVIFHVVENEKIRIALSFLLSTFGMIALLSSIFGTRFALIKRSVVFTLIGVLSSIINASCYTFFLVMSFSIVSSFSPLLGLALFLVSIGIPVTIAYMTAFKDLKSIGQ
jgi:hypothetical protein